MEIIFIIAIIALCFSVCMNVALYIAYTEALKTARTAVETYRRLNRR